jgi:hypothetical protein
MNKSNQIKDIVKEIQRVVPSKSKVLVCECPSCENSFSSETAKEGTQSWCPHCDNNALCGFWRKDDFGLSREITLQDLLLVIGKKSSYDIGCLIVGKLFFFRSVDDLLASYNMELSFPENLEQSDEFRQFVYNLICK